MVLLVQASRGPGWLVMFQLAVIQDIVKVPPSSFNREQIEVLTEELDRKYSNKVVMELGLCLCVYDFLEVGEGYVYPSEGSAHHRVKVRLVVFRPFIGEVLVGKVKKNETDGVRVTMGFFDDIFIPSYLLQQPSSFDRINKCWVWTYQNEDEEARYPMEYNDQIRFRVRSIVFTESKQPAAKGDDFGHPPFPSYAYGSSML